VLRTRLRTALVALPAVLLIVIFAPAAFFAAFIAVLTAWGLYEIGQMLEAAPWQWGLIIVCGAVPALYQLLGRHPMLLLAVVTIALMLAITIWVGIDGSEVAREIARPVPLAAVGAVWVGALFPFFALTRNSSDGVALILIMLLLVIASDSGAYFIGRFMGRMKLLPRVSPNKTVEGALGGLAASTVAALILRAPLLPGVPVGSIVVFGILVALLAQLGDLANSAYKRIAGVKDSGWIFPGHGGLLDRTCSLVFPAVLTYYYVR
jgi:phosphatidate cytidylyltransferase